MMVLSSEIVHGPHNPLSHFTQICADAGIMCVCVCACRSESCLLLCPHREQLSANINYALDEGPREDDTMQAMAEALDQAETCRQDLLELCTPPDTLGQVEAFVNQLEISVRSAKDILKQVKPHR